VDDYVKSTFEIFTFIKIVCSLLLGLPKYLHYISYIWVSWLVPIEMYIPGFNFYN